MGLMMTPPDLAAIEDKLQMRLEALGMYAQRAVKTAWHVGDLLVQAKAQVQHGGWLPWLERVGVDPAAGAAVHAAPGSVHA